jgi:mRNA interferase MazF
LGELSVGTVVLCRFPFSDLSTNKVRPCLIVGIAEFGDVIVCQITSRAYSSKKALKLTRGDFSEGYLVIDSYIRPDKLATLDRRIIASRIGSLSVNKLQDCKMVLRTIFEIEL